MQAFREKPEATASSASAEVGEVEHEPVADVAVFEAPERFLDVGGGQELDVSCDVMLGGEGDHFRGLCCSAGPGGGQLRSLDIGTLPFNHI